MKRQLAVLLLVLAGTAGAQVPQQPRPQAPAAVSRQAEAIEPDVLRNAGLRVAQSADAGKSGNLWDGGSAVLKQATSRKDFVASVEQRKPRGLATDRIWVSMALQQSEGNKVPAGTYATVQFASSFPGRGVMRETVTLRWDEDGIWRLAGYTVQ